MQRNNVFYVAILQINKCMWCGYPVGKYIVSSAGSSLWTLGWRLLAVKHKNTWRTAQPPWVSVLPLWASSLTAYGYIWKMWMSLDLIVPTASSTCMVMLKDMNEFRLNYSNCIPHSVWLKNVNEFNCSNWIPHSVLLWLKNVNEFRLKCSNRDKFGSVDGSCWLVS